MSSHMALALLLTWPAIGQVRLIYTPEPMAVLHAMYGDGADAMGMWAVRGCSQYDRPVSFDSQRVYLAGQHLALVSKHHAVLVLQRRIRDTAASRVARYAGWVAGGAAIGLTVLATQTPTREVVITTGALGALAPALGFISQQAQRDIPPLDADEILDGTIRLDPRGCFAGVVFAKKQPSVQVFQAELDLP